MMISSLSGFKNPFFIGVAGTGMSALAQYLQGIGKNVSGSDRYFKEGEFNETKDKLEAEGIKCFLQDGTGINDKTDLVVVSTAIEDTVYEVQKAKQLNIPIIKRSELLSLIAENKKTIAVGGTSDNSTKFVINQSHPLARKLSVDIENDFSIDEKFHAKYISKDFMQTGLEIQFTIDNSQFTIHALGRHNMENAVAAASVAHQIGVDLETSAAALKNYEGIYRRSQVYGNKNGVWLIDDYAHNPVKCAASIMACQPVAKKVIAWFQPHGYAPTKFLRDDFAEEISKALRPTDEIWMSEIFYAGGTTTKDISSNDLINDLKARGVTAFFVDNRRDLVSSVRTHLTNNSVLLLMGARDPSLEQFAKQVWNEL